MKKVGLLKLSSILIITLIANGCGRVYCPAFPEEIKSWFPYSASEEIKLKNNSNTISLQVLEINLTDEYSFSKRCDCLCSAAMGCKTDIDTLNLMSLKMSIIYGDDFQITIPPPFYISITLYEWNFETGLLIPISEDTFNGDDYSNVDLQDSILINGQFYRNVLSMNNELNLRFHKIVMAKEYGILKLIDTEMNEWERCFDK